MILIISICFILGLSFGDELPDLFSLHQNQRAATTQSPGDIFQEKSNNFKPSDLNIFKSNNVADGLPIKNDILKESYINKTFINVKDVEKNGDGFVEQLPSNTDLFQRHDETDRQNNVYDKIDTGEKGFVITELPKLKNPFTTHVLGPSQNLISHQEEASDNDAVNNDDGEDDDFYHNPDKDEDDDEDNVNINGFNNFGELKDEDNEEHNKNGDERNNIFVDNHDDDSGEDIDDAANEEFEDNYRFRFESRGRDTEDSETNNLDENDKSYLDEYYRGRFREDMGDTEEDQIKNNKPPTAPTNMVLFYTWMILAILIMVIVVSTYQAKCKGLMSNGNRQQTRGEDRKRLLDSEFV